MILRGFGAIVYKELLQMRRDPASLFLALAIPVIQLVIFGVAIDTEVRDVPMVVVDRAHVRVGRELTQAIAATGTLRVVGYVASRDEALVEIRAGRAKVALLIAEDLEQRLLAGESAAVQVLVDGSDSNLGHQSQAAALGAAASVARRLAEAKGASATSSIEVRTRFLYNPDGRSESFFVPGLAGIILQLVTMTLTAAAIVRERERGTLEQLMVTPVSGIAIGLGKLFPPVLLGAVSAALVFSVMVFVFDVPIRGSLALLAALTGLFLFTSLAIGLLISTIARSQLQALMMTILVLLPSVLLSGFVFPRDMIPTPIYEITWLIPATYFVEIMRGIVLRGASAAELAHMIRPLGGLGLVIGAIAVLRFRKTLD